MKWLMALIVGLAVTVGGTAGALEVGDKIGPVMITRGSIICDTLDEAMQAIDTLSIATPSPLGCGRLLQNIPALVEAVAEHEFGGETFMLLKILFAPRSRLGVQYGWEIHNDGGQGV